MADFHSTKTQSVMRLMGEAFVLWGEIEGLWRDIFPHILFQDLAQQSNQQSAPASTAMDFSVKKARADALWDSLNSSAAQLNLILCVAPLCLSLPTQTDQLDKLKELIKATHELRSRRNALAHSSFETPIEIIQSDGSRPTVIKVGDLIASAHAKSAIRGRDLEQAVTEIIKEFSELRLEIGGLRSWLTWT